MRSLLMTSSLFILFSCSHNSSSPTSAAPPATTKTSPSQNVEKAKESTREAFTCNRNSEIRSIWIESLEPQGCKLWYSNYKKPGAAASSQTGISHCQKVSSNIRNNLVSAGFKCTEQKNLHN